MNRILQNTPKGLKGVLLEVHNLAKSTERGWLPVIADAASPVFLRELRLSPSV